MEFGQRICGPFGTAMPVLPSSTGAKQRIEEISVSSLWLLSINQRINTHMLIVLSLKDIDGYVNKYRTNEHDTHEVILTTLYGSRIASYGLLSSFRLSASYLMSMQVALPTEESAVILAQETAHALVHEYETFGKEGILNESESLGLKDYIDTVAGVLSGINLREDQKS